MGKAYSYLNVWAVSTIVFATQDDLEGVLSTHEVGYREAHPEEKEMNYRIKETDFLHLLKSKSFHESDVDMMLNLFRLIDTRGFREIDLRDVMICYTVVVVRSVPGCLEFAMSLMEREGTKIIDKIQLIHILRLLNETVYYYGDKYLVAEQIQDLADSVYTSIGKIDGTIYYPHFIDFIATHPIIEMFVSPQYQGGIQEKLLDDAKIEAMVNHQR
mmetsp:Transcript_8494/g.14092  ORF Transcript_8494/g.14092 Transcript_8494/m.14092 type:complete len:215 (+) Transcript_8494:43-687(+)